MKQIIIFTDTDGRRWVTRQTLKIVFGIEEVGKQYFWDYDWVLSIKERLVKK